MADGGYLALAFQGCFFFGAMPSDLWLGLFRSAEDGTF